MILFLLEMTHQTMTMMEICILGNRLLGRILPGLFVRLRGTLMFGIREPAGLARLKGLSGGCSFFVLYDFIVGCDRRIKIVKIWIWIWTSVM